MLSMFFLIRMLILLDYYFQTLIKQLLGLKSRYQLRGECSHCGRCCRLIGVEVSKKIPLTFWLYRPVIYLFYEKVNNFKFEGFSESDHCLLFSCLNFDTEVNRCRCYSMRPALCRDYPKLPYFEKPVLLSGCSFEVIAE